MATQVHFTHQPYLLLTQFDTSCRFFVDLWVELSLLSFLFLSGDLIKFVKFGLFWKFKR